MISLLAFEQLTFKEVTVEINSIEFSIHRCLTIINNYQNHLPVLTEIINIQYSKEEGMQFQRDAIKINKLKSYG